MSTERIIVIQGLEVLARVGVPEEERESPQRLLIDLRFAALAQPESLHDDITRTVDYHALSLRVAEISVARPRKLIETLADELAESLFSEFSLRWVEVTIRKFILPNTEWVSVTIRREANGD
ncbi:MAG: dihydroneopterin aldolase [Chthoniobacterales bacterium]|nr:dihydroneopterin aldolase [Chthoniobacterales bacterium]